MASDASMAWQQARNTARARWAALGLREQRAVLLAAAAIAIALIWSVALAPALRSLKASAAQSVQLAAAAERMQTLQARALTIQQTSRDTTKQLTAQNEVTNKLVGYAQALVREVAVFKLPRRLAAAE